MASTTFIDNQTIIYASWLNDVNGMTYNGTVLNGILNGPTTLALQTGGLNAITINASQQVSISNLVLPTGLSFLDGTVQTSASYCVANNCMYENNQTITANYTITTNRSAHSVGPITIASSITVTVPSNSRWVIS